MSPQKFRSEDSLSDPVPTGKQKVMRVRDELWARVDTYLRQIEEICAADVNLLARVRKESSFVRLDKRKTSWGQYGPLQGNAGKHIDALAGVVFGYMECIELLDEILGDDSIGRKGESIGQGQGPEEGKEGAGSEAAPEGQGGRAPRITGSPHQQRQRRASGGIGSRSGKSA